MKTNLKKRTLLFILLNLSVLFVSVIYNILFKNNLIERCAFLSVFGFYCPGCGGSRSLNALLELKLIKSFIYYPPILITSLLLLYTDYRILVSLIKKEERIQKISYKIFLIIPISIILQFIVKNVLLLFGIDILGNVL